jgi:hypothetical protein
VRSCAVRYLTGEKHRDLVLQLLVRALGDIVGDVDNAASGGGLRPGGDEDDGQHGKCHAGHRHIDVPGGRHQVWPLLPQK